MALASLPRLSTFSRLPVLQVPTTGGDDWQSSENKFQCKLSLPAGSGGGIKRRTVRASVLVKHNIVDEWRVEIDAIKNVEHFCPELHLHSFSDFRIFHRREVEIDKARSIDIVLAALAEQVLAIDQ